MAPRCHPTKTAARAAAFDGYHPAVAAAYLLGATVFAMAAFQPVYLALSLIAALAYNVLLRGWRSTARTALGLLALVVVVTLVNWAFGTSGSTVVARVAGRRLYLECLLYGLAMGTTLAATLLWFSNLAHVLTAQKTLQLTGRFLPTIGLMVTMVLRLVPQLASRGAQVLQARRACTAAAPAAPVPTSPAAPAPAAPAAPASPTAPAPAAPSRLGRIREYARVSTVLMGWGMEDSLETSDAMRARGWGACEPRSSYARQTFRAQDGLALAAVVLLGAVAAVGAVLACGKFTMYPRIRGIVGFGTSLAEAGPMWPLGGVLWWGYLVYLVFLSIPFVLDAKERLTWSLKRRQAWKQ